MDFLIVPLLLILGYKVASNHRLKTKMLRGVAIPLYYYHISFSVIYYFYILNFGGDAYGYWNYPKNLSLSTLITRMQTFLHASDVVYTINYFPSKILGLSFFTGNIIYGTLGYFGILFLLKSIEATTPYIDGLKNYKLFGFKLFPYLFFIPNFHFWSSGVGKDTLSFFCICMFVYAIIKPLKRWHLFLLSIVITYFIRPHITLFLVAAYGGSLLMLSDIPKYQKLILLLIAIISFLPLLNYVLDFAKIDELNTESYDKFSTNKAGALNRTANTGVDISSLPYPLKVLTFLYRPFFFDAGNILGLIASFENLIWLTLSLKFLFNNPIKALIKSNFLALGSFLFWIVGALAFAPILSNLGIILREKNMFLPAFFIFILGGLSQRIEYKKYAYYYKKFLIRHFYK